MALKKINNTYTLTMNEKEFIVKYWENKDSKDKFDIYIQGEDMTFNGLKEYRMFINFLEDVCEELTEALEE